MAVDHSVHRGPTLSTHLSIAYSATAASSTPAAGSGAAASAQGTASASGGGSPGNFLAALIDQLLAGAATQTAASTAATDGATATQAATPTATVPNLLNLGVDAQATTQVGATPQGNVLLTKLTEQLQALQGQLAKGDHPDPDLLNKLGETADALAALIAKPAVTAPASATLDPLATLKSVKSNGDDKSTSDIPGTDAPKPGATSDQITQLLAAIGIQMPQASSGAAATDQSSTDAGTVTATSPTTPLPAIAQLATQLAQLSQAVAAASPDVAKKLDALTQKLTAAETDPSVLAQLTTPDDSGATSLDKIVQALLATKPTAPAPVTPQLASNIQLQTAVPSPQTIDRLPAPPAASTTASGTTEAVPKVATTTRSDAPAKDSATTTADAKIVAAATTQPDPKSDTADVAAQANTNAVAAPVGTQTAARAIPAAYQAATNPINMAQVAFEMVRLAHQGQSRFSIRIDPPELGRVDVRMHMDASGNVNAKLTVERSETLDMFQRDRGSLERALTQAGLDGAKTNLEFSLKQNPFAGMAGHDQRQSNGNTTPRFSLNSGEGDDSVSAVPSVTLYRGMASSGGVNLFV